MSEVQVHCVVCNSVFPVKISDFNRRRAKYCSIGCRSIGMTKAPIIKSCLTCGKEFETSRGILNQGKGIYCSLTCRSAKRKKSPIEKICIACGASFFLTHAQAKSADIRGEGKYCSRMCARRNRAPLPSPSERFWNQVDKGRGETSCWLWIGHQDKFGYGRFTVTSEDGQKHLRAHRYSYEMAYGKIGEGLNVCHKCDNPPCVNPAHLFLGTHQDNVKDKIQKGRQARGERNNHAKLTTDQVIAIREALRAGIAGHKLAITYGISPYVISSIKRRKTWRHIP